MMQRSRHEERRLIIIRLIMDLMRGAHTAYFDHVGKFAPDSDCVLMCIAVAIGQLEGRPMSASKISAFLGMPRASVIRKLVDLQRRGLIERPAHSVYTFGKVAMPVPEHTRALASLQRKIHAASTELSKLDS